MDIFYSTHLHITAWVVALILFIVALAIKDKSSKGFKITHMISRLFYIIIIITGAFLFMKWSANNPALYGVKMLLGIIAIGMIEMTLVRLKKGKNVMVVFTLSIVSLLATIILGFSL